jgi:hypothetical protein
VTTDLDREIAALLGVTVSTELWDEHHNFEGMWPRACDQHRPTRRRAWCTTCADWCFPKYPCGGCQSGLAPAYSTDLNATMAAIRERWPQSSVTLSYEANLWLDIWSSSGENYEGKGENDAERLARALLAALKQEAQK